MISDLFVSPFAFAVIVKRYDYLKASGRLGLAKIFHRTAPVCLNNARASCPEGRISSLDTNRSLPDMQVRTFTRPINTYPDRTIHFGIREQRKFNSTLWCFRKQANFTLNIRVSVVVLLTKIRRLK